MRRPQFGRSGLLILAVAGAGCTPREGVMVPLAEPDTLHRADSVVVAEFGGDHPGQAFWLSDNGRYALVYEWREDTNGDGHVSIDIGWHGEMVEDEPRPYLLDTRTGAERRYEELVDMSGGRWLALRDSGTVWLFDAHDGVRHPLESSLASDSNDCAGPRGLGFDRDGQRIGIVSDDGRFVVRSLPGMEVDRIVLPPPGEFLWRAEFTSLDDVYVLLTIPDDSLRADDDASLPRQITTCSSRLGRMFAASYSFMGWSGPAFRPFVVNGGDAAALLPSGAILLSDRFYLLHDSVVGRIAGAPVNAPHDCPMTGVEGSGAILLTCEDRTVLWHPDGGREIELPSHLDVPEYASAIRDETGAVWIPVYGDSASGAPGFGRLRMSDGRLEMARVDGYPYVSGHGWVTVESGRRVHALQIGTGRHLTLRASHPTGSHDFPKVSQDSTMVLIDATGERFMELPWSRVFNRRGCALLPTRREDRLEDPQPMTWGRWERGPWRVVCSRPDSGDAAREVGV